MLYYTIYVKNLNNGTGYIDIGLEDDQLLKDYQHFLDVGLASHKLYPLAGLSSGGQPGVFAIHMHEIAAMTATPPQQSTPVKSPALRRQAAG